MIIASATLTDDVPSRWRVEVEAPGVLDPWFPIEDLQLLIDGATQPRSAVEISMKNAAGGMLTIVNKTKRPWDVDALLEVLLP
jgi:hypothetical protein